MQATGAYAKKTIETSGKLKQAKCRGHRSILKLRISASCNSVSCYRARQIRVQRDLNSHSSWIGLWFELAFIWIMFELWIGDLLWEGVIIKRLKIVYMFKNVIILAKIYSAGESPLMKKRKCSSFYDCLFLLCFIF